MIWPSRCWRLSVRRWSVDDDNAAFTREVGHAATRAIQAFGDEQYDETVRLIRGIRSTAHRFGGSHAQRDVLDLTLLEAAFRSGQHDLAKALTAERSRGKAGQSIGCAFCAARTLRVVPSHVLTGRPSHR